MTEVTVYGTTFHVSGEVEEGDIMSVTSEDDLADVLNTHVWGSIKEAMHEQQGESYDYNDDQWN